MKFPNANQVMHCLFFSCPLLLLGAETVSVGTRFIGFLGCFAFWYAFAFVFENAGRSKGGK